MKVLTISSNDPKRALIEHDVDRNRCIAVADNAISVDHSLLGELPPGTDYLCLYNPDELTIIYRDGFPHPLNEKGGRTTNDTISI